MHHGSHADDFAGRALGVPSRGSATISATGVSLSTTLELLANSSGFGAEGDDGPVAILPHYAFPTGRHDPPVTAHSVWVHANWIQRKTRASTTMAKRNRLTKHGLWSRSCEREVNRTT